MNIIAVDDEHLALRSIERAIRGALPESSLACFSAPAGAIAYARENQVDVAFLDIDIGAMNGLELAKQLQNINEMINIVFATGYANYAVDSYSIPASGYILKPVSEQDIRKAMQCLRIPVVQSNPRVRIQTFGNFEVFVDGKPLQISRSKAKEMLAYLVDKRGTSVTTEQITAILWEDREYDRSIQKQTQTVISQLMKILRGAGIEDIILKSWNNISVDVTKFTCDYYRFMDGNLAAINAYTGEYMSEYSWAEMTAGMLTRKQ